LSKSGTQTTIGCQYVLVATQNDILQQYMSLTLGTCNVLVIYKVLALTCALSKSDRQATIRCKYLLATRQNGNLQQYMICHILLVHIICWSFIKY